MQESTPENDRQLVEILSDRVCDSYQDKVAELHAGNSASADDAYMRRVAHDAAEYLRRRDNGRADRNRQFRKAVQARRASNKRAKASRKRNR